MKINKDSGEGYYDAEATIILPEGVELRQGMAVEAKIVAERKSIMTVLLEKHWRPAIEVTLQNNDIEYFFTESHVIEGGNSIGSRRVVGVYGNIEYIPPPF